MQITPYLMFEGRAEEAINLYVSLFPNSRLIETQKHGESTLYRFLLNGVEYRALDSAMHHAFTFTPSLSLFIDFDDEANLDRAWAALSDGGKALMSVNNYGFSRKFGWTNDRFGVSWQLNLP